MLGGLQTEVDHCIMHLNLDFLSEKFLSQYRSNVLDNTTG